MGTDPDLATFFGSGFEFSGKTRMYGIGMVHIECKVHVCKINNA